MRAASHLGETFNAAAWFVGRHSEEGRGERIALDTARGCTSYAQLDVRVRRFAGALREAGVRAGDRVAFVLPDTELLVAGFFGAIAIGAVAVPLNTMLRPNDHRAILDDCAPRLVVASADVAGDLGAEGRTVWSAEAAEAAMARAEPVAGYAPTHRDAFAFFLYSSGTTGEPKGVVHLQHDMWVACETYGKHVLEIQESDRCFSIAKIFFAYGLGNSLYFPFHVGATSVLMAERPLPEAVFAEVRRGRPTIFFGVPTAYAHMLAAIDAGAAADFGTVRFCVSAGEALPGAIFERWQAVTGLEILDGIGSTEICHIFLSNRRGACRPGSSGVPVPGYRLRLEDETGAEVPDGELGDLWVEGDSTMAFYWNKHEATKATLRGAWIRTGDKYRRDADGYLFHAGRSDDMIKAGGIWVSPVEVEGVLLTHPAVHECAVVGEVDAEGLAKPRAFVVLRERNETDEALAEPLRAFLKERLAPYKVPRAISFVAELPKTATGKIQRFLLRRP